MFSLVSLHGPWTPLLPFLVTLDFFLLLPPFFVFGVFVTIFYQSIYVFPYNPSNRLNYFIFVIFRVRYLVVNFVVCTLYLSLPLVTTNELDFDEKKAE